MAEMTECKQCDFEHAKKIGRAHWVCGDCGRDLGIEYYCWAEAAHPEWFGEANLTHGGHDET